jgi:hypothetical protein
MCGAGESFGPNFLDAKLVVSFGAGDIIRTPLLTSKPTVSFAGCCVLECTVVARLDFPGLGANNDSFILKV